MKNAQNKMNDSSCSTDTGGKVKNCANNSAADPTENQGDLREIRNQGDVRDVTDRSGSKNRMNMTNS